jgi:hypothetical protein
MRWFAALIAWPRTLGANLSIPGTRRAFDRHIVQTSRKRDPRAPDTPTTNELFEKYKVPENTRRVARILLASGDFGRPMMVTPGTPADRVKFLREAYMKTLKDPAAIDEATKSRMDIDPTTGEDLEKLVRDIFDAPPEVIARARKSARPLKKVKL